jgi:phage gp36-like protein
MSGYATQADMMARFGVDELIQATDLADPPTGANNVPTLDAALADADSEINSYVATRYTLPLADPPRVLGRLACDMARYYLWHTRASEAVTQRYQDAVKFLKAVSNGTAQLGIVAPQVEVPTIGGPAIVAPGRVFTRDSLAEFR